MKKPDDPADPQQKNDGTDAKKGGSRGKNHLSDGTGKVEIIMSDFYCPVCGVRKVSREGEICSSCQDPYDPVSVPPVNPVSNPMQGGGYDSSASSDDGYTPISRTNRRIIGNPPGSTDSFGSSRRSVMTSSQQNAAQTNQTAGYTPQQLIQPTPQAVQPAPVPLPPTPANNSGAAQASANALAPETEGIVKNLSTGKDQDGLLARWIRSLVMGVHFSRSDEITEFQVYSNWSGTNTGGGYAADKVVVYGNIERGKPIQDNSVRVYGKRDKNRMIIATDIENTTDGTHAVFNPPPMSARTVRIITAIVAAVLILLILSISSGFSGGIGNINLGKGFQRILPALLSAAIAFFSGKRALDNFGKDWKNFGICAVITLVFAYVCISMITGIR